MKNIIYIVILALFTGCGQNQKPEESKTVEMETTQTEKEPTTPEGTEIWEPQPRVVTQHEGKAPSDAVVLFDGKHFNQWRAAKDSAEVGWLIDKEGSMTVVKGKGDIQTKKEFGSMQLHIEWRSPQQVESEGQGRGNSGIFLQNRYEIQVLDNFENKTYANGQAGSVYKQTPPLVNACKKPGEWQEYDIIFEAPEFDGDGKKTKSAYVTVLHNGVLVQNHTEIKGSTEYIGWPKNIAHGKGPIKLQDHSNPVSFRNIWVRAL